jgi:hypothetical protein
MALPPAYVSVMMSFGDAAAYVNSNAFRAALFVPIPNWVGAYMTQCRPAMELQAPWVNGLSDGLDDAAFMKRQPGFISTQLHRAIGENPTLAAAGGSGFALAKGRRAGRVGAKIKRMPLIAANGILVLIPSALFLAFKARAAEFDAAFLHGAGA